MRIKEKQTFWISIYLRLNSIKFLFRLKCDNFETSKNISLDFVSNIHRNVSLKCSLNLSRFLYTTLGFSVTDLHKLIDFTSATNKMCNTFQYVPG